MARRTKLTDEMQAKFCEAIAVGMTIKLSCQYAGISEAVYYKWRNEADAGAERQREFMEAVKSNEAKGAVRCLVAIETAAEEGSWQAAAWILERRHDYRRDKPMVLVETSDVEERLVDPSTEEGRETIISQVSQLPEEMILAALNRSAK